MKFGFCVIALHLVANIAAALPLAGSPPAVKVPVENCTNFSGDYRGTCIVEGKSITKSSHVEQSGCDLFTVDGNDFKIGSLVTRTTSDPASVETARFDWDTDRKSLLVTAAMISGSGSALSFHGQVTLEGSRLNQVLKIMGPQEKVYGTCALTRQ